MRPPLPRHTVLSLRAVGVTNMSTDSLWIQSVHTHTERFRQVEGHEGKTWAEAMKRKPNEQGQPLSQTSSNLVVTWGTYQPSLPVHVQCTRTH